MTTEKRRGTPTKPYSKETLASLNRKMKQIYGGTKQYEDWRKAAWAYAEEMKRKSK